MVNSDNDKPGGIICRFIHHFLSDLFFPGNAAKYDFKFDVTDVYQCNMFFAFNIYIICNVMADLSSSFLKINDDENYCLLCRHSLKQNDTVNSFTERGWQTLLNNAAKWRDINIPVNHEFYMFTAAYDHLTKQSVANGEGHERCRITISTKAKQFLNRYGIKADEKVKNAVDDDEKPKTVKKDTRQSNPLKLGVCFVCSEKRPCDTNPYNAGGLGSMSKNHKATEKLRARTDVYREDNQHTFHAAACRFDTQWAWIQSSELSSSEIYFHQSCYIRYGYNFYSCRRPGVYERVCPSVCVSVCLSKRIPN